MVFAGRIVPHFINTWPCLAHLISSDSTKAFWDEKGECTCTLINVTLFEEEMGIEDNQADTIHLFLHSNSIYS